MKTKRASALLFGTIVMFVILSVVISLSTITILETRMSQKTKSSTGAFFDADSGAEWALNKVASSSGTISAADFGVQHEDGSFDCPDLVNMNCKVYFLDKNGNMMTGNGNISDIETVRSVGISDLGDTTRAIEATVAAGGGWVDDGSIVRLDDSNDNVGIGTTSPQAKMHIVGSLIIGNSSQPCDGVHTGMLAANNFSGGDKNLYYCNGTSWQRINP